MIIEFADPGYNWIPIWIGMAVVLLTIATMIMLYPVLEDAVAPISMFAIPAIVISPIFGFMVYDWAVRDTTKAELIDLGFSDVQIDGDRFTAATEDGKYFRGVLVDLEPESGYAYQVLELTGTEK